MAHAVLLLNVDVGEHRNAGLRKAVLNRGQDGSVDAEESGSIVIGLGR
jgi:hypothetical protein